MSYMNFKGFFTPDISVDLGSANSLVYVKKRGIVIREPSVVAIEEGTKCVLAVGEEAKRMLERTPGNIVAVRPIKSGVIADFDITEAMLSYFIRKSCPHRLWSKCFKPRMVIAVPVCITEEEKSAVEDVAHASGAGEVFLIEEPMAAAIGAGLPVSEKEGCMIVDVGTCMVTVAIIALAGIVHSRGTRAAGDAMDSAIMDHMKCAHKLLIGERIAEQIKIEIGSAFPVGEEKTMEVVGRDVETGLPKTVTVTSEEIRDALKEVLKTIVEAVRHTLDCCEPELAADLVDRGIVLSGGGAQLRGLDQLLSQQTGLPVHLSEDPLSTVIMGAGVVTEELDFLVKNRQS